MLTAAGADSALVQCPVQWSRCGGRQRAAGLTASCRDIVCSKEAPSLMSGVLMLIQAGWLPTPLNYCAELFQSVSSHDLYLLFNSISEFMKVLHSSCTLDIECGL